MKKIKKEYIKKMNEVVRVGDNLDLIKSKLTFNNTKFKKNKLKLIIIPSLITVLSVLIIFISMAIVNYQNAPRYQSMEIVNPDLRNITYNETIEDDFPDVLVDENISSYAFKDTIIKIAIKLDNPKKFEILSFIINGYKYQSYEFQDGSNSDVIYVLIATQKESGIQKFTIDDIKYIDGTRIKNVRYEGNRTIKVGVTYENLPGINILTKEITFNSYCIIFNTVDIDNMITPLTPYKGYLFEGDKLIYSSNLNISLSQFSNNLLKMNTTYTFIVCSSIDALDGLGQRTHYMYQETFKTLAGVSNTLINSTKNSLSFEFNLEKDVTITKLELYLDEFMYKESLTYEFEDIYSNREYSVKVYYEYMYMDTLVEDFIVFNATTEKYDEPTFDFELDSTHTEILVNEIINDPFNLGSVTSYKLYLDDNLVIENDEFINLLANNTYKVEITYSYDLKDNLGLNELRVIKEIKTKFFKKPTLDFELNSIQNEISINEVLEDIDSVGVSSIINLYLNDILQDNLLENNKFSNLLSNTTYKLEYIYKYDLQDGLGIQELRVIKEIKTASYKKPTLDFELNSTQNEISINEILEDIDNVGISSIINLYLNDILQDNLLENNKFSNLLSNTTYKLEYIYKYNLQDGLGIQELRVIKEIKTSSYTTPSISGMALALSKSIYLDFELNDPFNLAVIKSILLYSGEDLIYEFESLDSYTTLTQTYSNLKIVILYSYDLFDGSGVIEKEYSSLV